MTSNRTVTLFGGYLVLLGFAILFAPALAFALIGLPPPASELSVIVGLIAVVIGYYYLRLSLAGDMAFVRATVVGRLGFVTGAAVAVILGALAWNYLILMAVEALAALWTAYRLSREGDRAFALL